MAVAMDAAVASIGNDHDVKLKYTVELRALNIQHMKNTLMVQLLGFHRVERARGRSAGDSVVVG